MEIEPLMNGDWQAIGRKIERGKKGGHLGHSDGMVD